MNIAKDTSSVEKKKSEQKPKVRKKVEKGKIAEHEICIELFGLRIITIKIKSAIIVSFLFSSFFLLALAIYPFLFLCYSVFSILLNEENPPLALFH